MAETQKTGRPSDQKQDEWQRDLNPDPLAGQNVGTQGSEREKNVPTAYEVKDVHRQMNNFTDDELKQIPILPPGTRLEQGATYIDLMDPERKEFTAMGDMTASPQNRYVAKTEVGYQLWNRLIGVENPERTGEGNL